MTEPTHVSRRCAILALKLAIIAAVCWGVRGTVKKAVTQLSQQDWQVSPGWLGIAGVLYLVGLAAQGWFWHRALAALGQEVPWLATARAYFLGHLGKYVPGKALVVILRVAGVRRWVTSLRVTVVSTLLETLTMMAVGAFLAAALAIVFLKLPPTLMLLAAAMAIAAGIPTLPPVARRLARLGALRVKRGQEQASTAARHVPASPETPNSDGANIDHSLQGITLSLLASGWVASSICWLFLGLSLWATLRSIGVDRLEPITDLPLLVAAVSLAVVAGFLSLLPGGLLVRDAILMQLLAPVCGDADALITTVLLRLVWLVTELGICGILYLGARSEMRGPST